MHTTTRRRRTKMDQKEQLKERLQQRFEELYPDKRLLAIQLNGFSHAAFFDNGNTDDEIEIVRYSAYAPEQPVLQKGKKMFEHIPHYTYQGNAIEIIYIMPGER